ncbi:hypothetical protein ScPMuIL_014185 [Solemya velum]
MYVGKFLHLVHVSTIERQVFDFLGYMWAPIIGNFFQLICVIIGGFGAYQYRPAFIAMYSTWSLLWLGWNVFVICLYLEVGILKRNREIYILNIGTKNKSWWLEHGIGCTISNSTWVDYVAVDSGRPIPPEEFVHGCILDYYYVEVIHAAVQCLLSLVGFIFSCVTIYMYSEEDESSAQVNDELEYVKMRYKSPAQRSARHLEEFDISFEKNVYNHPPSYETSMREATAVNTQYNSVDRRSIRSTRSKASGRHKNVARQRDNNEHQQALPWVHITPSNITEAPFTSFP